MGASTGDPGLNGKPDPRSFLVGAGLMADDGSGWRSHSHPASFATRRSTAAALPDLDDYGSRQTNIWPGVPELKTTTESPVTSIDVNSREPVQQCCQVRPSSE